MGDLLKKISRKDAKDAEKKYQVELVGLDVFDPVTMENQSRGGNDVPAWFLDTDYNGRVFHVCRAFFPRTAAWDNLKKAIKGTYDEGVWDHLAGTTMPRLERASTSKSPSRSSTIEGMSCWW